MERTSREIRRYYEELSSYPDAGDYYVAEMNYRRATRQGPLFYRFGLLLYWLFSDYGESAARALGWLLGVWLTSAFCYMYAGFAFGKIGPVRYSLRPDLTITGATVWRNFVDFAHALAYSFINLVPGYFRLGTPQEWTTWTTPFIVVAEAVFGVSLLTLFLLAIRRRFRR